MRHIRTIAIAAFAFLLGAIAAACFMSRPASKLEVGRPEAAIPDGLATAFSGTWSTSSEVAPSVSVKSTAADSLVDRLVGAALRRVMEEALAPMSFRVDVNNWISSEGQIIIGSLNYTTDKVGGYSIDPKFLSVRSVYAIAFDHAANGHTLYWSDWFDETPESEEVRVFRVNWDQPTQTLIVTSEHGPRVEVHRESNDQCCWTIFDSEKAVLCEGKATRKTAAVTPL